MTIAAPSAPPAREATCEPAQAGRGHSPLSFPAGGSSPASVRTRSRPRPRPPRSAPPYGADDGDDPRDDDAVLERMRGALRMAAEGRTQDQIAAHFGVSDRTIRAWLAKARELRLGTFRSTSAEDALAEAEESLRALEVVGWDHLRAATAAKYGRQAAILIREIADLIERRLSLRGRIGAFDYLRQDKQAVRDRAHDRAMGIIRPGLFEDDADWATEVDRAFAEMPSAAEMEGPPDREEQRRRARREAAQIAEFDDYLRSTGVDPADFHRAAKEGVFRDMAEEMFGPEH